MIKVKKQPIHQQWWHTLSPDQKYKHIHAYNVDKGHDDQITKYTDLSIRVMYAKQLKTN